MTPEPFHTACAISFRERPATAERVPGTDAGCGLSTRGHWMVPQYVMEVNAVEGTVLHEMRNGSAIISIMSIIPIMIAGLI